MFAEFCEMLFFGNGVFRFSAPTASRHKFCLLGSGPLGIVMQFIHRVGLGVGCQIKSNGPVGIYIANLFKGSLDGFICTRVQGHQEVHMGFVKEIHFFGSEEGRGCII